MLRRLLGIPLVYAVASSAIGFSIYFSLGVVADRGLGLTPLIFLAAGLMFALSAMAYTEGNAMLRERGGSSSFARRAFNELIGFVAGWAILIDYLIVIAAAAITVAHYLTPISGDFAGGSSELAVAATVIVLAGALNVLGITGGTRQARLVLLALADLGLQLVVIVVGVMVVFEPELLTRHVDLFTSPSLKDIIYSAVIATIAYAGLEAASDLTPDLDFEPQDLRRVLTAGAIMIPLIYAGIAAVALMAVPVVQTPDGPETALAGEFIENPILGVVQSYDPAWLADIMRWAVMLVAVPVLFWAANSSMLGLSRHVYVLATNRQIPSWAGKLARTHSTPYIAIAIAVALALALAIPGDIKFLAGIYAFGALLAVTIAQISILRLRVTEPNLERPYRVPLNVRIRGHDLPLPAILGAVVSGLAWISVFVLHESAVYVGGGWMLFGLVFYVLYRRFVEGTSLTQAHRRPGGVAEEGGPGGRVLDDPRARFRNQARRRHRRDRGASRRYRGGGWGDSASGGRPLRRRAAADGSAGLAHPRTRAGASGEGAGEGARGCGRVRERGGDDEPGEGEGDGIGDRPGGEEKRGRGDRYGRRASEPDPRRGDSRRHRRRPAR